MQEATRSSEVAWIPADLAPGDAAVPRFDGSATRVRRIRSADDDWFGLAYERLWAEFGDRREMEKREVIASRLAWDSARPIGSYRYLYEMLVVERGEQVIAVRDHTAIAPAETSPLPVAVLVHLSHVLVEPRWRGTGIAGWLRAFPLQAARECAATVGGSAASITLIAEMEPAAEADGATLRRLVSYGRAGFGKIDPARVDYAQPDFRSGRDRRKRRAACSARTGHPTGGTGDGTANPRCGGSRHRRGSVRCSRCTYAASTWRRSGPATKGCHRPTICSIW